MTKMTKDLPKLPNWKQVFHYVWSARKENQKHSQNLKGESLIKLMAYLQKYKQHGDTEYTAIYYRFRNVTVDLMLQSQGFYHKDYYSNIVNERNLEKAVQKQPFFI